MDLSFFKVVESEKLPNFKVSVNFMHGDADAYSCSDYTFNTEEEAKNFCHFIDAVGKFSEKNKYNNCIDFNELSAILHSTEDDARSTFFDVMEHDVTADDYRASYEGYEVFHYADGIKYKLVLDK